MNLQQFAHNLDCANEKLNLDRVDKVIEQSLSPSSETQFLGFMNLIVVNEEFAECQQQVSKYLRGECDWFHLIEEVADVWLSIRYIQRICNISDEVLNRAINVKIDRQEKRNEREAENDG